MTEFKIRRKGGTINKLPSKTDQSFQKECDVNNIIAKYKKTGQLTHLNKRQGVYADISDLPDLMGAHQIVQTAHDTFMQLPAEFRRELNNDPNRMIEYLQDPKNTPKAIELGLLTPKPVPEPSLTKTLNELNETIKTNKSKQDVLKGDKT